MVLVKRTLKMLGAAVSEVNDCEVRLANAQNHREIASRARELLEMRRTEAALRLRAEMGNFLHMLNPMGNTVDGAISHLSGGDTIQKEPISCVICRECVPRVRFHPCGHAACRGCSREIRKEGKDCHVCRNPIEEMQALYL